MWTAIIAAIVGGGGLTTVGVIVDRPALFSEVQLAMEQSTENKLAIFLILQQAVRDEIWELEDRIEDKGMTPERKQRLRELEVEYDRLEDEVSQFLYDGS